jgi:hypothetical protein
MYKETVRHRRPAQNTMGVHYCSDGRLSCNAVQFGNKLPPIYMPLIQSQFIGRGGGGRD